MPIYTTSYSGKVKEMPNRKRPRMSPSRKQSIAAVTGACGFIGSHLCQNLLEHGYLVRACVRKNVPSKVDHLLELALSKSVKDAGGILEVCVADMSIPGAYDEIFGKGCKVVFHVAGNFGTDYHLWKSDAGDANDERCNIGRKPPIQSLWDELRSQTAQQAMSEPRKYYSYDHAVYESYVVAMEYILASVKKNLDTVERVIYTSSGAAGGTVTGPAVADDERILENAYGRAKHDCEAMLYDFCKSLDVQKLMDGDSEKSLVGTSVCPCIVLGPMMGTPPLHDSVYPHRLSDMLRGRYTLRQHWDITDVRDVAETHRLAAETPNLANGTRFWSGHEPCWWISSILEYLTKHEKFSNETRFSPIFLQEEDSSSESGSESESESVDSKNSNQSVNKDDKEDRDKSDEGDSGSNSSSSSSSSCSSEDSFGISEWEDDNHPTTTWSNPISFFAFCDYKPRSPQQTVFDTATCILERWSALGRDLTIQECSNYYTVAEMDGCDEEMEWLAKEIRRKSISN